MCDVLSQQHRPDHHGCRDHSNLDQLEKETSLTLPFHHHMIRHTFTRHLICQNYMNFVLTCITPYRKRFFSRVVPNWSPVLPEISIWLCGACGASNSISSTSEGTCKRQCQTGLPPVCLLGLYRAAWRD